MSLLNQQALNQVNELATALGIDSWQIQTASWNGYTFATVDEKLLDSLLSPSATTPGAIANANLGGVSAAAGAIDNILTATKRIAGYDANQATKIPPGAKTGWSAITDTFSRKVAINSLPNAGDNIRGLGYQGQEIVIYGITWGANYISAVKNNFINMFNSDKFISPSLPYYHVLVHPFWGEVPKAWLLNMEITHEHSKWRAAIYKLRFRTEEPIGSQKNVRDILQLINDGISGVLSIANSVNSLWNQFNFVFNNNPQLKQFKNNVVIQNQVRNIQIATLQATNNTLVATKLITRSLAPAGYNNVSLNKTATTATTLPQIEYFNTHFTPNDVTNLVDTITANINTAITTIYNNGSNYYYDTIAALQGLISNFSNYAKILLENFYGKVKTYIVPYDMNLFLICVLNNLDYEQNYSKIIALNQNKFFWLNKLNKGDSILLPISQVGT